jgi:outer membrane protein TolC
MKHVVGFFFTVFLFSTRLKAQKTFTVSDCINYAFGHNQLLNAASKDTLIAGIGVQRVKGYYLPRVNFASALQYYFTNRTLIVEGGTPLAPPSLPPGKALAVDVGYNHSWYPSLNVDQLIFSPSYRNSYNIALQSQQLQAQQLVSFKIDLVTGIYKAFSTYKLLEKQARFLEENIARIDTLTELTRIKFESGAGVKIEVNRVEVTGNRMKGELASVRKSHMEALLALQFQMNYLEQDSMILTGDVTIPQIVSRADTIMQQLLQSNPSPALRPICKHKTRWQMNRSNWNRQGPGPVSERMDLLDILRVQIRLERCFRPKDGSPFLM